MMILKTAFQGGVELNFFAQREFESTKGVEVAKQPPIIARNTLRFLLMGWTSSWNEFLTPTVLRAIFLKRDHELLRELRFAFQQGFFELFEQLKQIDLADERKEQIHLYLSNCLSLLPFADLTPYESIQIPQYISGQWEMVEYQVTPIELTANSGWRRFFIQDYDRVFAYGLEPLFQRKAESHLLFMGTTYPAGQGFLSQVNTDSKGFETVGKSLYRTGRDRIQRWLSQQEHTTHVCGVSLGGSLSLLLALDRGNYKLSRVDALNPAGLHDAWTKSWYDHWDELIDKPQVVVQKQGNDPVSAYGTWKKDWKIIQVIPPKDKQGPNRFCDHFLNYAGFADTKFTYIEAEQDNNQRNARNFWLYSLGRSLIYYGFLLPYTYVIRPLVYSVIQDWVFSVHVLGIVLAATLTFAGVLPGLAFLVIMGVLLTSNFLFSEVCFIDKKNPDFLRQTDELSEREQLAELHDPSLARNSTMDIYDENNDVDINLTYQQIRTYYQMMRCLVKRKEFIMAEEKESKHVKGMSKKALLQESLNPQGADDVVIFKVSKAKAAHIRHTLTLVHQLGIVNEEKLKQALEKSYAEYRLGKPMPS